MFSNPQFIDVESRKNAALQNGHSDAAKHNVMKETLASNKSCWQRSQLQHC
jgi:hypothetical protein